MIKTIHRADSRGYQNYGWLKTRHSFSFSRYYNPERMNFGMLRVLNDDVVRGGTGFDTHPHNNMEIVSIPLFGAMVHKDSTGQEMVIREGDVQIMSAGSGLFHSEYNQSGTDDLSFLQVWVIPRIRDIEPKYQQKAFPLAERRNMLKTVIAPDNNGALWINQDAWFTLGHSDREQTFTYKINREGNGAYIFILEGKVQIDTEILERRDAIGISEAGEIEMDASPGTEFLVIEVPME